MGRDAQKLFPNEMWRGLGDLSYNLVRLRTLAILAILAIFLSNLTNRWDLVNKIFLFFFITSGFKVIVFL